MDSSTTNRRHETPARLLCAGGCGFFGSAESRGLCSNCYNDYLNQLTRDFEEKLEVPIAVGTSFSYPEEKEVPIPSPEAGGAPSNPPAARRRCGSCMKKVGLLGFVCRCGGSFCGMHRLPEAHGCGIDFKKAGKILIRDENPHVEADKIARRI